MALVSHISRKSCCVVGTGLTVVSPPLRAVASTASVISPPDGGGSDGELQPCLSGVDPDKRYLLGVP